MAMESTFIEMRLAARKDANTRDTKSTKSLDLALIIV
jgi:hypothetical protein